MISDTSDLDTILITWSLNRSPDIPQDWHDWGQTHFQPDALDKSLDFPEGTISVIKSALEMQLPRKRGWISSFHPQEAAIQAAALIYRRGVALKGHITQERNGQYFIKLTRDIDFISELPDSTIIIIDEKVKDIWNIAPRQNSLILNVNETSKSLKTVSKILEFSKSHKNVKSEPWVIIGGGALADSAAFALALNSIDFILVPTTLLSMVDACVGGKTGVNFPPFGKNQIGLFAFPSEVIISPKWLKSLPRRELVSGLAEVFKAATISGDSELAEMASKKENDHIPFDRLIMKAAKIKADIITRDPDEKGERMILNLGHTLGHAIERISQMKNENDAIFHGEAVAVGLLFTTELSLFKQVIDYNTYQYIWSSLQRSCFLISPQRLEFLLQAKLDDTNLVNEILTGIRLDKKINSQNTTDWVLIKSWGNIYKHHDKFTAPVTENEFVSCYQQFIRKWMKL